MTKLTIQNIEAGYENDEWLGFGYLGGRKNALDSSDSESPAQPERVVAADAAIIEIANSKRWSVSRLFTWLNSKPARWFADEVFGSDADATLVVAKYVR